MSLFSEAEQFLRESRVDHLSIPATYHRGSSSVSLQATQGSTDVDLDSGQSIVRSTTVDWIVDTAELVLDSIPELPRSGDRISATIGSVARWFEVMDLGPSCYRPHGRDGLSIRIHTRRIATPA